MKTWVAPKAARPRKDGRCLQCRGPVKITPRPGLDPASYLDPFCKTQCARAYYGTSLPVKPQGRKADRER